MVLKIQIKVLYSSVVVISVMDDVNHQDLSDLICPACFFIDLFNVSWSNLIRGG